MMPNSSLDLAMAEARRTELSPLEEVLFKAWMDANHVQEDPDQIPLDLRGVYKDVSGKIFPWDQLNQLIEKAMVENVPEQERKDPRHKLSPYVQSLLGLNQGAPDTQRIEQSNLEGSYGRP